MPRIDGGNLLVTLFGLAFLLFAAISPAMAESRTALVVGNSGYSFAPLANPKNDADDIAKALKEAGFEVQLLLDAEKAEILDATSALSQSLKERGGVGLFFFAGHGVQIEGENYLLPIGAGVQDAQSLKAEAVKASEVVEIISSAKNDLNIVILDACRDNPLTGGTSGLSRIDSSASLFVSYSTSPGTVALDGEGRNSPYTKHLTLSLATPNLNLEQTFKQTLKGVYQETKGQQTPWLSSSFFGDFVFNGEETSATAKPGLSGTASSSGDVTRQSQLRVPDATETRRSLTGLYKVSGTNPDGSRYKGMLALEERDDLYDFTWWIGKDVFKGKGELAGRMLVVHWNDLHPVVYSFEPDGVLDGEWADGTATDRLTLFATADSSTPQEGVYTINGRNTDGSKYSGEMTLSGDGENYTLAWEIGNSSYSGEGRFRDGLMVVDWGGVTPLVYALAKDGSLVGLWDGGQASETAMPQ